MVRERWQPNNPERYLGAPSARESSANSICGLVTSTVAEQRETRKGNAGKFLNRAGKKALTSAERAKREEIQERRLSKKNKDDSESPGGGVLVEGTRSGCKGKASNLMSTASGSLMPKKSDTRSTWQARQS